MTSNKTSLPDPTPAHSSRSLRILLAEDDTVNQHLVKRVLSKSGHEVVAVGDGRQAVTAKHSHDFDVLVMDLDMPVMNGLEAIREIRDGQGSQVPIIALTSLTRDALRDDSLVGLIDVYLTKPVDAAELLRTIEQTVVTRNAI
jgi:CheY-like chemotaxis protein